MGSDLRFDYSVLGDPVNLASRLESRSKSYGLQIVIGANTADKIGDKFAALELDLITVKGKTRPERVYTLLGADDVAKSDDFQKLREWNDRMLSCYRRQDWTGALEALQRALHAQNNFGLTEVYTLYSARIAAFQENAPPADWDGVFAFDTK
jgi:adenylate cyclase